MSVTNLIVLLLFQIVPIANSVPHSSFYPYGLANGDSEFPANDDGSTYIDLSTTFVFYEQNHNRVYVNNNGDLSFVAAISSYTSSPFPLSFPIIAPYWADVDTRGTGRVFYRETTSSTIISKVASHISNAFPSQSPFTATGVVVVTWYYVGYYSYNTDKTNTFQCILATDGYRSYVIFLYLDNGIQWTTGDASGGSNGFGGTEAQVGFNAGDNTNYFAVPGSRTSNIVNIETTSNIGIAGMWVFQVNDGEVESAVEEVSCGLLQVAEEAIGGLSVNLNGTSVYSIANYSCTHVGYSLVGEKIRICRSNGSWNGSTPSCQLVNCGALPTPPSYPGGLSLSFSNTVYNSIAKYACNETGYKINGSLQTICGSDGNWNGTQPNCILIDCGIPESENTDTLSIVYSNTTYGGLAFYYCEVEYNLIGNSTRMCDESESWSNNSPFCQIIDCEEILIPPGEIGGLSVEYNQIIVYSIAEYNCTNIAYQLIGTSQRVCQLNGTWSGNNPYCELIDCGAPESNFTALTVAYVGTTYGSIATYTCLNGFTLIGDSERFCSISGHWSNNAPRCQIVDCGLPNLPSANFSAVNIAYTLTTFNSIAKYDCDTGYEMVGQMQRICMASGEWSGEPPQCQIVHCNELLVEKRQPGSLEVIYLATTFNSTALYYCSSDGFHVVGIGSRACGASGEWLGEEPYCATLPLNFTATVKSSTSVYLSWALKSNSINLTNYIDHFVIEIEELNTSTSWKYFVVNKHAPVEFLHPYYTYRCRVAVFTDQLNPFTKFLNFTTLEDAPDAPPQNLDIKVVSSRSLNLSWISPPSELHNGVIQFYTIQIYTVSNGDILHVISNISWVYIDELHPYYSYTFQVSASTISMGPYSLPVQITMPEEAPSSPPTNVLAFAIDYDSIKILWQPPEASNQNGIIREYTVNLTETDTGTVYNLISFNNSVIAESLHANYNYSISVRAVTISPGPFSEPVFVLTNENVPNSSPENFTAVITSPYSAVLSWETLPIDQQNGIITGYLVNVTVLETNAKFQLHSHTNKLVVNALKPFRTYICMIAAQTSVGVGPYSSQYVLKTPQDAPSGPPVITGVTLVTKHGFFLSWDSPDEELKNGVILYYQISVTETQTNTTTYHTSYSNSFTLSFLHPAYTYQCMIAAYTVGLGPFSLPINVTTAEDAPTGPPRNLTVIFVSSVSVKLTWSEPSADLQNGVIISYLLNITSQQSDEVVSYTSNTTSLHVLGLKPFVSYSCVVSAVTSVGIGPYTLLAFMTLEAAPSSPPSLIAIYSIDSSSVAIIWSPPPKLEQNGVIREYWINVTNIETGKHWINISTTKNTIIKSLLPSFTYEFEVAAYTVALGPYCNILNLTMPEAAPSGFPTSITGMATSPNSIELNWEPPSPTKRNGKIIHYVIDVTQTNTLQSTQYFTTFFNLTITELDPYTTYVYVIAAETAVGIGPFSHLYFIQTPEAAPESSPESISGIALNSTSIHITWDPPKVEDQNGIIIEYRVNVTEARTGITTQYSTNQTQIIINHLKPYHVYHCYIGALTVEEGPYSSAVSVLTEEDAPSISPQGLQITVVSPSSASLSWNPPPIAFQNGIIRNYHLTITSLSSGKTLTFIASKNEANITGLTPYTKYEAQVAAFTVAIGPYSSSSNFTTFEDIPSGSPEQFNASSITSNSFTLSWKPPSKFKSNGIIKYYNISVLEEETGSIVQAGFVNDTFLLLTDLHPFYNYKCTLSAVTIGEGPFISLSIQMLEDAPAVAPKNLTANSITSSSAEISWLELLPENRNGVIRHYVINITELNTGSVHIFTSLYEGITLHSLHPYYEYAVAVAAYTVTEGPFSLNLILRTDEDKPSSSPLNLQSVSTTSSSASFLWNPPPVFEQNGVIIGYNVSFKSSLTEQVFLLTNTTSIGISTLNPFKVYKIAVAACTSSGTGPFTVFLTFQTDEDAPLAPPMSLSLASKTSTSLSLEWLTPNETLINGIIRSYLINVTEVKTSTVFEYETTLKSIIINGLHPFYNYECSVAAFTVATGPFTVPLKVQTTEDAPSGPPVNIKIDSINSTTLNISWKPPDEDKVNGIVNHYIIKISELETLKESTHQATNSPIIMHSLHPFYTYSLIIAAYTVELGPFSNGHSIQLPPDSPSGPPKNLTAEIVGSSTATFVWSPPLQNETNGLIYSYQIILHEQETNTSQIFQQSVLQNSFTTNNLHPFYHYIVSVAAYTIGLGPSLSINILTLEDVPSGSPKNPRAIVLNSTSVIIEWNPPDLDQQNGVIKFYKIAACRLGNEIEHKLSDSINTNSIILTGLYPYSEYTYEVSAVTIGPGPVINGTFQTDQDVPSTAPTDLISSIVSSQIVLITWSELSSVDCNGIITEYTISLLNIDSNEKFYFVSNSTSLTLENLSPFTSYKFSLAASTVVGRGPFSAHEYFKTLQDAPSSYPMNISTVTILSTSFTLVWLPPPLTQQNGIITGYKISLEETKTKILTAYFTIATNITISSLNPFSVYNCSVAAITVATGPFSSPVPVKTFQAAPSAPPTSASFVVLSHDELQIIWDPPPDNLINGLIEYYVINITVLNTSENHIYFSNITFIEFKAHAYYTYNARVAAATVSVGPFTQDISVTTPQNVPSGPPQNITCDSINSSAVRLSWNPPLLSQQNGQITSYHILVFEIPSNSTKETLTVFGIAKHSQIIGNLHPFYEYRLSIAANTVGLGPYGVSHIITDEDAPTGPPQNLTFMPMNSTSLFLTWAPPIKEHQNGFIQSYSVQFKESQSENKHLLNLTETQLTLSDLHPFYIYNFDIAAVTTVAPGPYMTKSFQMPEDAPSGSPNNLTASALNHTSLYITWNPPFSEMQNGIIRNYSVIIKDVKHDDADSKTYYAGKQTGVTVSHLHPFQTYEIKVAAITLKMGPFSDSLKQQLPESTPSSPPVGLKVHFDGSSFNLTWTSPPSSTHNGILLGYNITCNAQNGHQIVLSQINGTSAIIQGIQNNTHYTCSVCSYTSVGCGPSATTHMSTYTNSLIGPPVSLRANASSTVIFTEWISPFDPDLVIASFTLVYQLIEATIDISTPRPFVKIENITDTTYILQSLLINSVYSMYVYAVTIDGQGPSSDKLIISTTNEDLSDPQNLKCSSASFDSLLCTWEHPLSKAYTIDSYQLNYRLADGFNYFDADYESNFAEPEILSSDTQQYRITNLLPYTGCIVEVRADLIHNSEGDESGTPLSDYDSVIGISTTMNISLPQAPLTTVDEVNIKLRTPTSVHLSWKPPNKREWRGRIQTYAVSITTLFPVMQHNILLVAPENNNGDPSLASEPLQSEECTVNHLEEGFEYQFQLSIVNSEGSGPFSNGQLIKIPENVPSTPPKNITALRVTESSIYISWQPPDPFDSNGVIINYSLEFRRKNFNESILYMISAEKTEFLQKGLHAFEEVVVRIAAETAIGLGPYSFPYSFFTSEKVPSSPLSLHLNYSLTSGVLLTWKAPEKPNGVIKEYQVLYYSHTGSQIKREMIFSTRELQLNITNYIVPGFYEFKVRARNSAGFGENATIIASVPGNSTTTNNERKAKDSGLMIIFIPAICAITLLVFFLFVIVCMVVFVRKRNKEKERTNIYDLPMSVGKQNISLTAKNLKYVPELPDRNKSNRYSQSEIEENEKFNQSSECASEVMSDAEEVNEVSVL